MSVSQGTLKPVKCRELNPNQSDWAAQLLAIPDVNTCCSFAYGNEKDD